MKLIEFTGAETGVPISVNLDAVNAVAAADPSITKRYPGVTSGTVIVINNQSLTVKESYADVVAALTH